MKNITQNRAVAAARPSLNRCRTGRPGSTGSCAVKRVPGMKRLDGAVRVSSRATRSSFRPDAARKRTDSGSPPASTGTSSSGATPPTRNTDGQPKRGISAAAISPPSAAPSEKPQNIAITIVARRRCGLNSAVSATAFGIAPPRPSPVRNRRTVRLDAPSVHIVASVPTPKAAVLRTMMRLRPTRSASGPNSNAPSIRPNSPALNTGPSAVRGNPQVRANSGAT